MTSTRFWLLVSSCVALAACNDSSSPNGTERVSMQDECDPSSFNAALGDGTCTRQGNITFADFNSELNATQDVAAWQFDPASLTIHVGQSIEALNDGGEEHSFTEVEAFGGGIIPSLNTASGNPVEAPECAALTADQFVTPGSRFRTDPADEVGTEYYQCCNHPWMRTTVTVEP